VDYQGGVEMTTADNKYVKLAYKIAGLSSDSMISQSQRDQRIACALERVAVEARIQARIECGLRPDDTICVGLHARLKELEAN
jgi:hypothetical protein